MLTHNPDHQTSCRLPPPSSVRPAGTPLAAARHSNPLPPAGHLHPATRRQQAASNAAHLLEVASASSLGTPSSRQVGRAPDSCVIPRSVFFDFALGHGAAPGPRWGHTATAVGDRLWVYGGMGSRVFSDLHVYSPGEVILPAQDLCECPALLPLQL